MAVKRARKIFSPDWLPDLPLFSLRGLPEVVASSGISARLWRAYAQTWLVCLVFPLLYLSGVNTTAAPLGPVHLFIALAGLAVFVIVYTGFMWSHPLNDPARIRSGVRARTVVLAGLTVLVLYLSLAYGSAFLWLFVGLSAMIGISLPAFGAFLSVLVLTLLTLATGVWTGGGVTRADWLHLLPLVLLVRGLGLDMVGVARLSTALRELHAARGELARQAVTEERLRLARDLHDLLGHSLSMITLKSELAGRLIEKDPARAAAEIGEIERAARQALGEVREAVAGYRRPDLRSELDGARQILEAAGIGYEIEHTCEPLFEPLPPGAEAVLAWAVREGVTNVIRHCRARRCRIQVSCENGRARVEVVNDGCREQGPGAPGAVPRGGLAGLAERAGAYQGRVEAGPFLFEGEPGFRLRVELPLRDSEIGSQERRS